MKSIVFISCIVYHLATIVLGAQETDYNIDFDKIESYNGTDDYYKYTLNVVKKDGSNSIFIVDSTIDLLQDLDSSWMIAISLHKLDVDSNQYEEMLDLPAFDVCTFMKTIYKKYFYETISQYSDLPHYNECPVPARQYTIKGYPFDVSVFRKQLKPGSYRLNVFSVHNKIAVSGVLIYGSVTEKS